MSTAKDNTSLLPGYTITELGDGVYEISDGKTTYRVETGDGLGNFIVYDNPEGTGEPQAWGPVTPEVGNELYMDGKPVFQYNGAWFAPVDEK